MKQFIKEHDGDEIDDKDFEKVVTSMSGSGKSKAKRGASSSDFSADYT